MAILSEQDILNYRNNGFLIKKNFFNESEALEILMVTTLNTNFQCLILLL